MEKAINIKEAAAILSISVNQLYRLTSAHKVPFFQIGAAIRFLPSQLEKFMLGEWTPRAPKRRPGRQMKIYPQKFTPETDPHFQ